MRLNATEKNAKNALEYILWALKLKVTASAIKEELCLHPDFPSVAAVSDALSEWKIPNLATRLHPEQIREIPLPALAYLKINGGILAPVKSVKNDMVTWLDTQNGWQTENITVFQQKWDGITLLIEPQVQSGETDYAHKRKKEWAEHARLPLLLGGLVFVLAILANLIWNSDTQPYLYLLLGSKLIGTALAGLLLWQSVDTDNPFLQSLCQVGNRNNCNGILQSQAAQVTSWLSWSEVGFFYFAGGLLSILFALLLQNFYIPTVIGLFAILALPYTVYSVYYQKFVARQWCKLCMAVQAILWLEAILVLSNVSKFQYAWNIQSASLIVLAFLIPVLIWIFVKNPVSQASQVFGLQRELQKVKFNENYIQTTFQNQPQMPPIFEDMQTAVIGNPDAPHMLTVVTNPLCGPCSRLHEELNHLLDSSSTFQCQFVFLGPPKAWQIAANFLSPETTNRKALMESWYADIQQSPEKWMETHKGEVNPDELNQQYRLHARWCELAGITGTPTTYINGVKLPTAYKIRDLKRVVPLLDRLEDNPVTI